jgi:hypothetical protein
MSIEFNVPVETETLDAEEIERITGRCRREQQIEWFNNNGWRYSINAGGAPIVGRFYARFKLAGVDLFVMSPSSVAPDFTKVK